MNESPAPENTWMDEQHPHEEGQPPRRAFGMAFFFLLLFTIFLYTRPQDMFPFLNQFRIPKIVAGLATLSFLLGFLSHPPRLHVKNLEARLMLVLLIFIFASVPMSYWPGGSVSHIQDQVFKVYLIFFLIIFVVNSPSRVQWLLFVLLTSGAYIAVLSLMETGETISGRLILSIRGMAGDPNDRALIFVFMFPLAVFSAMVARSILFKIYYAGLGVFFAIETLHTFSRGGLLGLVAVIGLFCFRMMRERKGIVVLVGLVVFVSIFFMPEQIVNRASSLVNRDLDTAGTISTRLQILQNGLDIMARRPIFGVGVGCFTIAEGAMHGGRGKWNAAHNTFLEIGAETGIFGLITFVALIFVAFRNLQRIQRDFTEYEIHPEMVLLARGLEIALAGFCVSAFFLSQAYTWHIYYLMGLSGAMRRIAWRIESEEVPEDFWDYEEEEEVPEAGVTQPQGI
jgi:O-antigen ligase